MKKNKVYLTVLIAAISCSCQMTHRLEKARLGAGVSLPVKIEDETHENEKKADVLVFTEKGKKQTYATTEKDKDGKERISVTLKGVTVTAKSKSVPERGGKIKLDFVVSVPSELLSTNWVLNVTPNVFRQSGKVEKLEDIVISGKTFKDYQSKGERLYNLLYQRYTFFDKDTSKIERFYNNKYNLFIQNPTARLDTIIKKRAHFEYYYSQDVLAEDESRRIGLGLSGKVFALDKSTYNLPLSDTIKYVVSSMMQFVDRTPRFKRKIVERKALSFEKANITFQTGNWKIIEDGNNKKEIERISSIINSISKKESDFVVDSIVLLAGSSIDGNYKTNLELSKLRAISLQKYLSGKVASPMIAKWKGEDWDGLNQSLRDKDIPNKENILSLLGRKENPDKKEMIIRRDYPLAYEIIKNEIYPNLRTTNFKIHSHRKGMVKDTIHTTEIDSIYLSAIHFMECRKYSKALNILNDYSDWNTAICLMSLGYDEAAYNIFSILKEGADRNYLLAILATRLNKIEEGYKYYCRSCELDPTKKFRGALDPEIQILIKSANNK